MPEVLGERPDARAGLELYSREPVAKSVHPVRSRRRDRRPPERRLPDVRVVVVPVHPACARGWCTRARRPADTCADARPSLDRDPRPGAEPRGSCGPSAVPGSSCRRMSFTCWRTATLAVRKSMSSHPQPERLALTKPAAGRDDRDMARDRSGCASMTALDLLSRPRDDLGRPRRRRAYRPRRVRVSGDQPVLDCGAEDRGQVRRASPARSSGAYDLLLGRGAKLCTVDGLIARSSRSSEGRGQM